MFCYQCEQTANNEGCTKIGICGKKPEVAYLQDLLIYLIKGLSKVALLARKKGITSTATDEFTAKAIFSTLTNVNFDPSVFVNLIHETVRHRDILCTKLGKSPTDGAAAFIPMKEKDALVEQGKKVGIITYNNDNNDILSLKELLVYGLKGVAAYTYHAAILGQKDNKIFDFLHEGMAATLEKDINTDILLNFVLKCGEINLQAMELLDKANTETFGHPVVTAVPLGSKFGKAILVSGHDIKDLATLLKQTDGKGINIYTHGEMLPTHGYPELKKYKHFYGHYGTAWQNQQKEFEEFPGSILMTTNCIQKPSKSYNDKIFTTGLVGFPEVQHVDNENFMPVIEKALSLPGFNANVEKGTVNVGFARNTVIGIADKVITGIKENVIRHFFLVAGCDGAKPGRNYYTEFVEKVPNDCIVLTLACGKFRFFDKDLGDINGIPRLLDIGQCNDAYSAIQIALALADAFNCGVNDLPLSMVLSWYEQKAVSILLTLLHLGIKNIRLGPSLPAFISTNILEILVDKFNIMPITSPDNDLKAILK